MKYYLVKADPETDYGIDDLKSDGSVDCGHRCQPGLGLPSSPIVRMIKSYMVGLSEQEGFAP